MLTPLLEWLGKSLGSIFGSIVAVLFAAVVFFLFWGIWWDRILSKAGFVGKQYWLIFGALYFPLLLVFISDEILKLPIGVTEWLIGLTGVGMFGGLVAIALLPWPIRKAANQRQE